MTTEKIKREVRRIEEEEGIRYASGSNIPSDLMFTVYPLSRTVTIMVDESTQIEFSWKTLEGMYNLMVEHQIAEHDKHYQATKEKHERARKDD